MMTKEKLEERLTVWQSASAVQAIHSHLEALAENVRLRAIVDTLVKAARVACDASDCPDHYDDGEPARAIAYLRGAAQAAEKVGLDTKPPLE